MGRWARPIREITRVPLPLPLPVTVPLPAPVPAAGELVAGWVGRPWRQRGTRTYVSILSATTLWAARHQNEVVAAALYRASTNLEGLAQRPLRVLVHSAFWIEPTGWRQYAGFVAVAVGLLAPLEHRLGTPRWLAAFTAGHVGATLLNAAGLRLAVGAGWADGSLAHAVDVGWSYGAFALAGAGTWVVPERHRLVWALALEAAWLAAALRGPTFTDLGHGLALFIGFAIGPDLVRGLTAPTAGSGRHGLSPPFGPVG